MLILVSYDIVDNKRRTRLAKKLLNFGMRVQYSVFECDLNAKQIAALKKQALAHVNLEADSLRIYKICETCVQQIESFGIKKGWEDDEGITVI